MQVKKFEAKNMKDALEMVKNELGPDAVILRAKETSKGFGLMGASSVEITAAVSEVTLKKKGFAESGLRVEDREKLRKAPAKAQKDYIEKSVARYAQPVRQPAEPKQTQPRAPTSVPYADISDDGSLAAKPDARPEQELRIKGAVKSAARAFETILQPPQGISVLEERVTADEEEVHRLRAEIRDLRETVDKFRGMPRTIVNVHPGADYGLPYEVSFIFEKLFQAGLSTENIVELLKSAVKELGPEQLKKRNLVEAWTAKRVLSTVKVDDDPFAGRIHLFVGPGGLGKTSMLAKLASHFLVKKKKRVALITTDRFKIGAADQLKIYAQILNAPFSVVRERSEWSEKLRAVSGADVVLVDFPGFSLRDADEIDSFRRLLPPSEIACRTHLVQSATSKDIDAIESGRRYGLAQFQDVIFTHIDGSANHGVIYNFQKYFDVPLHSFGTGPRIPNDFEVATKERVLDLIFKLTQFEQKDERSY